MGGAPYKPVNEGGGCSFKCFRVHHERVSMYAYSDSLPTNLLKYCSVIMEPWALEAHILMAHNTLNDKMLP